MKVERYISEDMPSLDEEDGWSYHVDIEHVSGKTVHEE